MRTIEKCGTVVLCLAVAACAKLPESKTETTRPALPEPDTKVVTPTPVEAQQQPEAPVLRGGRHENLTCYTGTEDRHARIGVELVNDQVNYFAYYSKWKPRTCSIEAGRGDARSRWTDNGKYSTVTLADRKGQLRIEREGSVYRFSFLDVDRVRYCGMQGRINGTLTVTRGKDSCAVQGVMDGHGAL